MCNTMKEKIKDLLYIALCEREKNGNWESIVDSISVSLVENTVDKSEQSYCFLMGKISSLRFLNYKFFRKTIFDCMTLIDKIN